MTRDEMVQSLSTRFGGSLYRIVGNDIEEVDRVLTEGQQQVADEMAATFGFPAMPAIVDEYDEDGNAVGRTPVSNVVNPIDVSTDPTLPSYYHQAIVLAASMLLAQRMGDASPKFKDPVKLEREYLQALSRGHQLHNQTLNAGSPNRIVDGYFDYGQLYEEF